MTDSDTVIDEGCAGTTVLAAADDNEYNVETEFSSVVVDAEACVGTTVLATGGDDDRPNDGANVVVVVETCAAGTSTVVVAVDVSGCAAVTTMLASDKDDDSIDNGPGTKEVAMEHSLSGGTIEAVVTDEVDAAGGLEEVAVKDGIGSADTDDDGTSAHSSVPAESNQTFEFVQSAKQSTFLNKIYING